MNDDYERLQNTVIGMGAILEDSVNALRGAAPDDCSWSTHDVGALASTAAALANAYLAASADGAGPLDQERLRAAADAWRAVRADTLRQANEMIAWRDNPGLYP